MYHIATCKDSPSIPDSLSKDAKDFLNRCFKYNPLERDNVYSLMRHKWLSEIFKDDQIKAKMTAMNKKSTSKNVFSNSRFSH
jgi:mitogen-activated protein kinase kinase kinase